MSSVKSQEISIFVCIRCISTFADLSAETERAAIIEVYAGYFTVIDIGVEIIAGTAFTRTCIYGPASI